MNQSINDSIYQLLQIYLRSCKNETNILSGKMTGNIPLWLNGALIRNGPGLLEFGEHEIDHIFDGSALLHRFEICDGKVTYQNKFLRSDYYTKNLEAKRIIWAQLATQAVPDPCKTVFQRITSMFFSKDSFEKVDNALVSVQLFGGNYYAMTESPIMYKINVDTLETEEKVRVNDYITILCNTAHPHVEKDGTTYNLGTTIISGQLHYCVLRFPSKDELFEKNTSKESDTFSNAKIVASIPSRWYLHFSYFHSFGITENYYIIIEQPLHVSIPRIIINNVKNEPFISALKWQENIPTRISVVCRKTGKLVRKFLTKTFFYFHIINQYDQDDLIILDLCAYEDARSLNATYCKALRKKGSENNIEFLIAQPTRFVLPLKQLSTTFVEPQKLCDQKCELPQINYTEYSGKRYRYFYALSVNKDALNMAAVNQIIKVDVENKKTVFAWGRENCFPSEPVFVASPDAQAEDDGVLLVSVLRGKEMSNTIGLVVLNAKDLRELGIVEFETSEPIPKCIHGRFVSK